jgi:hypothetical protein
MCPLSGRIRGNHNTSSGSHTIFFVSTACFAL